MVHISSITTFILGSIAFTSSIANGHFNIVNHTSHDVEVYGHHSDCGLSDGGNFYAGNKKNPSSENPAIIEAHSTLYAESTTSGGDYCGTFTIAYQYSNCTFKYRTGHLSKTNTYGKLTCNDHTIASDTFSVVVNDRP